VTRLVSRGQQAECCCPTKLIESSVRGSAWTSSATVRGTTEGHVDVTPQSLMGQSVLDESGYVPEERVLALDDGL